MATTTINYGFIKPELEDSPPDISVTNANWDILDEELKNHTDGIDTVSNLISNKLDKTASPNRNLLHNWDFTNLVNQRGLIAYSTMGYTVDRWRLGTNNGVLDIVDTGVKLTCNTSFTTSLNLFIQYVENAKKLANKTVTISVEVESISGNFQFRVRLTSGGSYVAQILSSITDTGITSVTGNIPENIDGIEFQIMAGSSGNVSGEYMTLKRVKLELGFVSTLVNDPPADYGEQLALCQRYYYQMKYFTYLRMSRYSTDLIFFILPLPVNMRINPSLVDTPEIQSTAGVAVSGFTFSTYNFGGGLIIRGSKTAHGLTDGTVALSTNIAFSADL